MRLVTAAKWAVPIWVVFMGLMALLLRDPLLDDGAPTRFVLAMIVAYPMIVWLVIEAATRFEQIRRDIADLRQDKDDPPGPR